MLERFKAADRVLPLEISAFVPNCGCTRWAISQRIRNWTETVVSFWSKEGLEFTSLAAGEACVLIPQRHLLDPNRAPYGQDRCRAWIALVASPLRDNVFRRVRGLPRPRQNINLETMFLELGYKVLSFTD
jgi:hypothetical protein